MFRKSLRLAVVLSLMTIGFIACSEHGGLVQRETLLDQNWGRSYESAMYNQILNPDAGNNQAPVEGLEGVATENTIEKYNNSFKIKKDTEVTNILKLK
ncbi:MAG: hypothetical protein HY881_04920 [Deltaproteobacteria bacterium]|nr:hypothetical protein [Deltaproteobacteria bacterium]